MEKIEYRVRPVTRFIVTRHYENESDTCGGSSTHGEFDNFEIAYEVGCALCKAEHDRLGLPPGDERMVYPQQILRSGETPSRFPDRPNHPFTANINNSAAD